MIDKGNFKRTEMIPINEAECHVLDDSTDMFSTYVNFGEDAVDYLNSNSGYIRGYDGIVDASIFPIDIDSEDALQISRDITGKLMYEYDVHRNYIIPYFSGKKGIHLYVSASQFGISPTL